MSHPSMIKSWCAVLVTVLSCAWARPGVASEAEGAEKKAVDEAIIDAAILAQAFDFEPWLACDDLKRVGQILAALEQQPSDPATLILFRMHADAFDRIDDPNLLGTALARITEHGAKLERFGANTPEIVRALSHAAQRMGDLETMANLDRWSRGIDRWLITGPFARLDAGDVTDEMFPPELLCDSGASMRGAYGEVRWMPWVPQQMGDTRFSAADLSDRKGAGWFALAQIDVAGNAEQSCLLELEADRGGVKAWLNGEMVLHRRPARDSSRDDVAAVKLRPGQNTLLLKLGGTDTAGVRLVDPVTRLSLPGLSFGMKREQRARFVPKGKVACLANRVPSGYDRLRQIVEKHGDAQVRGACATALALVLAASNAPELAEDYWHAAQKWRAVDSLREACLELVYYDLPGVRAAADRNTIRRKRLEWLLKTWPEAIQPRLMLAPILRAEAREGEAAKLVDEVIAGTDRWWIRVRRASLFASLRWSTDVRKYLLHAFANSTPPHPRLTLFCATLAQGDGDTRAYLDLLLTVVQGPWPGDEDTWWRIFEVLQAQGEFSRAREVLKRIGALPHANLGRCDEAQYGLLVAQGDWRAAATLCQTRADMVPRERARQLARAASLLSAHGAEDALSALDAALEADPSQDGLRRMRAQLRGEDSGRLPSWCTPVDATCRDWLKAEDWPLASAGYPLQEQVWLVNEDGSFVAYTQEVVSIFRQEAVDAYGRRTLEGEPIRVRTFTPDGRILEPVSVQGTAFEFPGVQEGACIDCCFREVVGANASRTLRGQVFRFADTDLRVPTAVARLVVVTPPGFILNWRQQHMEQVVHVRETLSDGRVAYRWELRAPRSMEPEPGMPPLRETLPAVVFTDEGSGWAAVARKACLRLEEPQVTWLVRATTQEVLAAKNGDTTPSAIERARTIYDWINQTILAEGSGEEHPHATIEQRAGNRSNLFRAMLEAAQVRYREAFVARDPEAETWPAYLDVSDMFRNHLFVIEDDTQGKEGRRVFVDLRWRCAPFGEIGFAYAEARAILIDPEHGTWEQVQMPGGDAQVHRQELMLSMELDAQGGARLQGALVQFGDYGYEAHERVHRITQAEQKRNLEGDLSPWLAGMVMQTQVVRDPERVDAPFARDFGGSMQHAALSRGAGALAITPHLLVTSRILGHLVAKETRHFDIELGSAVCYRETLRYVIPQGWVPKALPEDFVLPVPPFDYSLRYAWQEGAVVVTRTLHLRAQRIPVASYPSLREQLQRIDRCERREIEIEPASE